MKLGFIGMGNMASAIYNGIVTGNFLSNKDIVAYDINSAQFDKLAVKPNVAKSVEEVIKSSEIILVAVKPQVVESVIKPVKDLLKNKVLVSIVLGYDFDKYNTILDQSTRHVFVMPNTPARVLCGMSLVEEKNNLTDEELKYVIDMFKSFSEVEIMPSHLMSAAGSLSGCGPAFVYMMIEALADAAVLEGVPRDKAYKLASTTVMGSGKMQLETGIHPGILKDNVCSPGGSTIRGVNKLEESGFRSALMDALRACVHYKD